MLGHGKSGAFEMHNDLAVCFLTLETYATIADVRDEWKLDRAFKWYRLDVAFHAAARKHLLHMGVNSEEALTSKVFSVYDTAQAADKYKVRRFMMISIDKAMNSVNAIG